MLQEDPRRTHVAAGPERIVALYESVNQATVHPSGRGAQTAQAVVVGLAEPAGAPAGGPAHYEVLVVLTLTQSGQNVIYALGAPQSEADLPHAIEGALDFAESMGFILDSTGWVNLEEHHRIDLVQRLPAFRPGEARAPAAPLERTKARDPLGAVARLFAAFAILLSISTIGCTGMSSEQRGKAAEIHYDLGTNLLNAGDAQGALREYRESLENDPDLPDTHNGLGLIYAYSFGQPDQAQHEFEEALKLKPDFSEARTNLGALDISRGRFAEAVPLLEKSASDTLYKDRVIAQTDLGWALYKTGATERGVRELKGALTLAPKFCIGWRQLGTIYSEQNQLEDARIAFQRYAESCPEVADAHLLSGKLLVRLARAQDAQAEFKQCAVARTERDKPVAAECARLLKELGSP
jgi:type IV pilus assembly protein PilF